MNTRLVLGDNIKTFESHKDKLQTTSHNVPAASSSTANTKVIRLFFVKLIRSEETFETFCPCGVLFLPSDHGTTFQTDCNTCSCFYGETICSNRKCPSPGFSTAAHATGASSHWFGWDQIGQKVKKLVDVFIEPCSFWTGTISDLCCSCMYSLVHKTIRFILGVVCRHGYSEP